jgi:hypothetical protein
MIGAGVGWEELVKKSPLMAIEERSNVSFKEIYRVARCPES